MITHSSITLFHYDEQKEEYIRQFFRRASVYYNHRSVPTENGFVYANTVTVRIPTREEIVIREGDYVYVGEMHYLCREASLKVVGYSDNRRGSFPIQHWRINCE
ncbi:MAG: hypothetical protein J6B23_04350 [Clostridia bacterium]|nr:hypothetical protein [Clostridia bacterium]